MKSRVKNNKSRRRSFGTRHLFVCTWHWCATTTKTSERWAQLYAFPHCRHRTSSLHRGMKLIVIARQSDNSHLYFFFLAYVNNRRTSERGHVVSSRWRIIVQKRARDVHRIKTTTIGIYPVPRLVYFDSYTSTSDQAIPIWLTANRYFGAYHQKQMQIEEDQWQNSSVRL